MILIVPLVLDAVLSDHVIVDDRCVAHLHGMVGVRLVSRGGGQRSRIEVAALVLRPESISHRECVLRPQLQIEASREIVADVRTQKADAVVGVIDVYAGAVWQYRIRNLPCIHTLLVAPLAAQEERSSL